MACAVVPWFVGEPLLLRLTTALAAAVGVAAAVTLRRWDAAAGLNVAELKRARASAEWQHEERVAELEADLEEGRELRIKLEQRLRAKRAELAALRNEHAALLRRYATAETERASALEGRRLLELEAADPVPQLPPARETRALGPAPVPEPVRAFSPAGGGLFRQAVEALDALEELQAAAGAEDADLGPGTAPGDGAGAVHDPAADVDMGTGMDMGTGIHMDVDMDVDAEAGLDAVTEAQAERDAERAPAGYEARPDAAGPDAGPVPANPGAAETGQEGVDGSGTATGATQKTESAGSAEASPGAAGAGGAGRADGPQDAAAPQDGAVAGDAEDSGIAEPGRAPAADGPQAGDAGSEPDGPTASGSMTVKPVRPSGGHFTVPTAVAVVPAAPGPRRPSAEGSFDFFGTQSTEHRQDRRTNRGQDQRTDQHGDERTNRGADQVTGRRADQGTDGGTDGGADRGPDGGAAGAAGQGEGLGGHEPSPSSRPSQPSLFGRSPQASPGGRESEPRQQSQPLIRPQQTQHRGDVGRVIEVDAQDDDLHAAS